MIIISFFLCKAKLDLGFITDASGSLGLSKLKRCLQFIKNLVDTFIVWRHYTRFGAVLYNTKTYNARYMDLIGTTAKIRFSVQ